MFGKKKRIAVFHNLPEGGGLRMVREIISRYEDKYSIDLYIIGTQIQKHSYGSKVNIEFTEVSPFKGFFLYNFWVIFILPIIHRNLSERVDWKQYKCILFTHDYFTKSPYLLRYANNKNKYYLCQESQREFYENVKYHGSGFKDRITRILRLPIKWIDRSNTKHATKLFCNSKYSKRTLEKIYKKKFEIIYPGVDEKFFSPSKLKKTNSIVCVGGINKTKNQEFLVHALLPILDEYKLILIGDGEKKLKNELTKRNKNIFIKSGIDDNQLRNYYRTAKLTCIAAYKEPFGLSSIESQACGTPVVAVDSGGVVETIINGETGYISRMEKNIFLNYAKKALKRSTTMGYKARKNITKRWTSTKTLEPLDRYL